ncbi:Thermophilic serine proteinase precursor [compost metagenome]
MKKKLLLFFLLFVNAAIAQFSCTLDGVEMNFELVKNKIFVQYNESVERPYIGDWFGNDMMNIAASGEPENHKQIIKLNQNYTQAQIKTLLELLNKSPYIKLASPLVTNGNMTIGLSDQLIVRVKTNTSEKDLNDLFKASEIINNGTIGDLTNHLLVSIPKNKMLGQFTGIAQLKATGLFEFIEPNFIIFAEQYSFNDPLYSSQYAHSKVQANNAWNKMGALAGGSNNIVIAVLDDGVDLQHPEFAGKLINGFDASFDSISASGQTVLNTFGGPLVKGDIHGTRVAGVLGAKGNNGVGLVGLAYNCKIMPIRVGETSGQFLITNTLILRNAIHYAYNNGADVITNSWGNVPPSTLLSNEITFASTLGRQGKGCPIFFASGNNSSTTITYPASVPAAIAVGATTSSDKKASYSDYSLGLDIAAPGDGVITTDRVDMYGDTIGATGSYTTINGTSYASPYAAALMGLILSVKPSLTQTEARQIIESTCDKVGGYSYTANGGYPIPNGSWSSELGYGRINAEAAVAKALLNSVTTGPFVATITQPAVNCYWTDIPATSAYFDLQISGGSPDLYHWDAQTGTGYKSFSINYWAGPVNTNPLPSPYVVDGPSHPNTSYFTQNTIGPPSGNKRVYLDLSSVTHYPFQTDIYLDIFSPSGHNYVTVSITVNYAPEFTLIPQVNHCNFGNLYTYSAVNTMGAPPGSIFNWALGNYPSTAVNIDYTSDPKYPFIYGITSDETITLSVTAQNGCTTSRSTLVKVGNIKANPAPAPVKKCSLGGSFLIGPSSVTGNIGFTTFQWTAAPGLSPTNSINTIINPAIAGTGVHYYTLTATDANGCTATFVYEVDIQTPQTTVNLTADYNNGCPGHVVNITGNISGPYGIYYDINYLSGSTLLPTVLITPTLSKTTVWPYVTTVYQFSAKDPYGCPVAGSIPINVQTTSTLAANAGADTHSCAPDLRTITGSASGGTPPYDYLWVEPSVYDQNLVLPNVTKTYTLEVKDFNGCRAQDQVNITSSPVLNPAWSNPIVVVPQGGVVTPGMGQGHLQYGPASGGTSPYTYLWTPSSLFVDPTVYNPTTQPLYECFTAANTVTDALGCTATRPCALYINVAGERSEPFNLIPDNDICNGKTLQINNQTGGLGFIGGSYANVVENGLYNNIYYTGTCQSWTGQLSAVTSYSFNPAPISQSGNQYSFPPNTTNVTITANQTLADANNFLQPIYRTYTLNYTFPSKDDSRNNLLPLGTDAMIYVGSDQLLHKLVWESIGNSWRWNHYLITPQGSWGAVRVEGWLAVNSAQTKVYFKGTDQKMYQMIMPLTASPLIQQLSLPTGMNVKSDIIWRQDGVFFIGDDNFIHRFNPTTNVYDPMLSSSAYGGLTVVGHLAAAVYPQTHLAFLNSDNKVRYLYESPGWQIGAISGTISTGETMIDPQNGDIYYKTTANQIETLVWNNSTKSYGSQTLITAPNDPNYSVDGYMVKDPGMDRIFYKDMAGRMANIYKSGGVWYSFPFDYNQTDVAGDIRLVSQDRFFYINKNKSVHEVTYTQTGWFDRAVALPWNVKACSYNYKSLLQDGEEFSDVSESIFKVYPNPANTKLAIEYVTEVSGNYTITLMDVTSRIVKEIVLDKNQEYLEMDLGEQVEGVYFVNLFRDGTLIDNKKIIIQH